MPSVAGHSARVALRDMRMRVVRGTLVVALLALLIVACGQVWLALASRSWLPLPSRGSAAFAGLAALEPSVAIDLAVRAAGAALESGAGEDRAPNLLRLEFAQQQVVRQLAAHPLQPRLWLLRARLLVRANPDDARSAASVKMAYFSSSAAGELSIERLRLALQLKKLDDAELSDLVQADLTAMLLRPETRSAISEVYRDASVAGRALLLRIVTDVKPDLLSALH